MHRRVEAAIEHKKAYDEARRKWEADKKWAYRVAKIVGDRWYVEGEHHYLNVFLDKEGEIGITFRKKREL